MWIAQKCFLFAEFKVSTCTQHFMILIQALVYLNGMLLLLLFWYFKKIILINTGKIFFNHKSSLAINIREGNSETK